jgi:hypothetical protein
MIGPSMATLNECAFADPDAASPVEARSGSLRNVAILAALAIAITTGLGARADQAVSQRTTEANLRLALTLTYGRHVQARERCEHRPVSLRPGSRSTPPGAPPAAHTPPATPRPERAFDLAQSCPWLTNLPPPPQGRA